MKIKPFITVVVFATLYLSLFACIYHLLTLSSVYDRFFSSFIPTYDNLDGNFNIVTAKKAFTRLTERPFTETMDAYHYATIKNNLYNYNPNDEVSRSNFAFFPLFPLMWKVLGISGIGISIVNFLLHCISLIILIPIFCRDNKTLALLAIFSLPTLVVFLIPYSEGLFMLSISLALLGWKKENKLLYITGLLLASMTRPVFILLIASCIATEVYQRLCDKHYKINYKNIIVTATAILSGVFLVALFQYTYHHGSLFTFINAQKHWGTYLQIPKTIVDWSNEGYAMNVWALAFSTVFGGIILLTKLLKAKNTGNIQPDYWYNFSWMYLLFATLFVIMLQGGCLHSLYRYTLCTPFFYIIILKHLNTEYTPQLIKSISITAIFIIACFIFFAIADYGKGWNFTKTGYILLSLNLLFFIVMQRLNNIQKYTGYGFLIISGLVWNCYLLNMFISKAWVFL